MLKEFRSIDVYWDKATRRIYEEIRTSSSDEKGRKLTVQIVNDGQIQDLTGSSLNLYWETENGQNKGLDPFEPLDAENGIYELYFRTGMLSNVGKLKAHLHLVDVIGTITSEQFTIIVFNGVDVDAIASDDELSALNKALIEVQNIKQEEIERVISEESRISAEAERVNNENARKTLETERESNETSRITAEIDRETAESGRITAENERVIAEAERAQAVQKITQREIKHTSATVQAIQGSAVDICTLTLTKRNTKYLIIGQTSINIGDTSSIISCDIFVGEGAKSVQGMATTRTTANAGGGAINARLITTHDNKDSTVKLRGHGYSSREHNYTGNLIAIEL